MNQAIQQQFQENRDVISGLCQKMGVRRLRLFGSATEHRALKESSDLDFVVGFSNDTESGISDRFLTLAQELERIFQRKVDLLTERSLRNPIFRQVIDSKGLVIYEA
jgi:uncharacterized protein